MKRNEWFVSQLDDLQNQIAVSSLDKSLIVQGPAGSGKTNLAIHRAAQANLMGTFAVVVYTKALRRMVEYGLGVLGQPRNRAMYKWGFTKRGFDLAADVYCVRMENGDIDRRELYACNVEDESAPVYLYTRLTKEQSNKWKERHDAFLKGIDQISLKERRKADDTLARFVTIDFEDYVEEQYYRAFGRRSSFFERSAEPVKADLGAEGITLMPRAVLAYQQLPVDYLIVDEAQDFSETDLRDFKGAYRKSMMLLGDTAQQLYEDRGMSLDRLQQVCEVPRHHLSYNYRIPKSIAKVTDKLANPPQNLYETSRKNGGRSDFPLFPKPIVKRCESRDAELAFVVEQIESQALDDVAILASKAQDVEYAWKYLQAEGIDTQARFKKPIGNETFDLYQQIDTLEFDKTELPCLLTLHSAKGCQFENVFILFAENDLKRNLLYVGMTRSSNRLFITYTNQLTSLLKGFDGDIVML